MYNPSRYRSTDTREAFELMDRHPFATLLTVAEGKPFVSHLPLTPRESGEGIELIGHLARANPHWKHFAESPVTVIFQGAHTYITPQWYAENDVPTWNYSTVHVTGEAKLIEDGDGLIECLKELTAHVERLWPSGWEFFIPEDLCGDVLTQSIVGFRIVADRIDFKKKLSQNRTPADRAGALRGLETRSDDQSRAVLQEMLKLYSPLGEWLK
jgi:transcriptional regulator